MKEIIKISIYLNILCVGSSFCQTPVTSYTITNNTSVSTTSNSNLGWNASAPYDVLTTYTNFYGQASGGGAGLERVITGFAAGGNTYVPVNSGGGAPFDVVWANRHPSYGGDTLNMLYEYTTSSGNDLYHTASYIGTLENVINSTVCNRGSDNLFSNSPTTRANFERIDLIKTGGIFCVDPTRQGFLINERGGNDNFKCAAITAINGSNIVTSLGTLTNVLSSSWGAVGPSIITRVMSRRISTDTYLRAKQDLTTQSVSGVFISFSSLGITAGTTIYGLSLFPNDVTSGMDLIGLTNVPSNTDAGASGGLDLMAGEIYAVAASLLSATELNFSATRQNNKAVLKWNNEGTEIASYIIERSLNTANNFSAIATISNTDNKTIEFSDPLNNLTTYYRLQLVKKDGQKMYSNTVVIKSSATASAVRPTMVQNGEMIVVFLNNNQPAITSLYTSGGQLIKMRQNNGASTCSFETNGLKKGMYYIKVNTATSATVTPVLIQ